MEMATHAKLFLCFVLICAVGWAEVPDSVTLALRNVAQSLRQSQRYEDLRPFLSLETQRDLRRWPSSHRNRLSRLMASELAHEDAEVRSFSPRDSQSGEVSVGTALRATTFTLQRTDAEWTLDLREQLAQLQPAMEVLLALDRFDEAVSSGQTGEELYPYLSQGTIEALRSRKGAAEALFREIAQVQESWKDLALSDFQQTPGVSAELHFQHPSPRGDFQFRLERKVRLLWEDSGWRVDLTPLLETSSSL